MSQKQRVDYGVDAPGLVSFFLLAGIAALFLFSATYFGPLASVSFISFIRVTCGVVCVYLVGMGCLMLFWSKFIKIRVRDNILDHIQWRGDEQVLDIGCGRGLMMIGAAKKVTTGKSTGIDLWLARDQSANSASAALQNALLEGVNKNVEVQTADMRSLPFQDGSFDIILSHWAVHNLENKADRNLTLQEINRVLRPGGKLILADIENRDSYMEQLKKLGFKNCRMDFQRLTDFILGVVSFGNFRPTIIFAEKPD